MRAISMGLSIVALLSVPGMAVADKVKVYEKAPSVEELQRQLAGDETPTPVVGKKKTRTRAIVFGGDAAAATQAVSQEPAAQDDPPAAARPAPTETAAYSQTAPIATGSRATEVSERAIAFPINFRVNSAEILSESVPFLESIAGLLNKDPNMRLVVEGHTDATGAAVSNLALSRERAFSVMNYLIDNYRINPLRLIPVGKGFSESLDGLSPTNPKNRRVQFRIIG